jgi:hypothetical protein
MTTYSFVQYDVLNDLIYFKGTPTPGLVDTINQNKNDINSIKAIIQNDTTGQLTLLPSSASQNIKNFLATVSEISLADSQYITLTIAIIDDTSIGNVDVVSRNLDGTKTYATKGGASLIISIDILKPGKKWPTMGKCRNCLKFTFDEDNEFNFTGNIGGNWDGTWKNGQKVYDVNIPTFATPQSFGNYTNYKIFWKPNVTYSGLDYNGNAINIINTHKWICVPSSSIGTPSELSNTTFFHVLNNFSASCAYAPPTTTWYNFFGKNGYFLLENTALPALQTNSNQSAKCPQFSPTPGDVDWGYNCGPNGCVATPSGSIGTYATLAQCQTACVINYGWNCTTGGCVSGSAANPGVYATLAECQSSCIPDYGWNCTVPGGCIPGTETNPGVYDTLAQCELACPASYGYNCVNGNCVPGTQANPGTYDTIVECTATCSAVYGWNCTPNGCVLGDAANTGSYATQAECQNSCFYPDPEPTFCSECIGNLVTNGDFTTTDNWIATPSSYTPGTGIMLIDPLSGYATAGVNSGVQFNNDNTSSISLTQANVFNISCSYTVCFQAWTNIFPANSPDASISIGSGNYPVINVLSGLTQTPTAYTVILNNVATNNLTFYFGLASGSLANNAEINIDNICVTLLSCPPEEVGDCLITGSAYNYEEVEYDCLCPTGYISNGSGSCFYSSSAIQIVSPLSLPTASYSTSGNVQMVWNYGQGFSVLQPPSSSNTLFYPTPGPLWAYYNLSSQTGTGNPSLYYQYNLDGTGNSSTGNPSPITGNPNIYKTQYTFDILKAPFWTSPSPIGNPPLVGIGFWINTNWNGNTTSASTPLWPVIDNPYLNNWILKRARYVQENTQPQQMWFGCGTAIPPSVTTKTYYLLVNASREFKIKLNGVTLITLGGGQTVQNNYASFAFPMVYQNSYARRVATPLTGLGSLPSPFYGNNPYISYPSRPSGSLAYFSGIGVLTSNGTNFYSLGSDSQVQRSVPSIYPITIPSGSCGVINVEGRPGNSCDEDEWIAAVLFDNTATQIANANDLSNLNIVWDTSYLTDLRTIPNNITNFPTGGQFTNPLHEIYFYGYLPNQEPSPESYIPVCPPGSTPISGSACNGCLSSTPQTLVTSIPCGQCIECTHGRLYNGYVVDKGGYQFQGRGSGGIVNTNLTANNTWVIPAESDWDTLITYLNNGTTPPTVTGSLGTTVGGELKDYTRDLNATCWENPNIGAQTVTGSSGWAGTAGGKRDATGTFSGLGFEGIWWSANSSSAFPNPFQLYTRELKHFSDDVYRNIYTKNNGFSLRLVRPAAAGEANGATIAGAYTGNNGMLYDGIVIGTQVWIDKNLSETLYNNSSTISTTTNSTLWSNTINSPVTASSCFYNNDSNNNVISAGNIDPLTGECYTFPTYYVYQKCDSKSQYLVQSISGSTTTPGKVQRDSNNDCWEFISTSAGLPNYPNQINYLGNYFSGSNYIYDDCTDCSAIHTIYMKFGTKNC